MKKKKEKKARKKGFLKPDRVEGDVEYYTYESEEELRFLLRSL